MLTKKMKAEKEKINQKNENKKEEWRLRIKNKN